MACKTSSGLRLLTKVSEKYFMNSCVCRSISCSFSKLLQRFEEILSLISFLSGSLKGRFWIIYTSSYLSFWIFCLRKFEITQIYTCFLRSDSLSCVSSYSCFFFKRAQSSLASQSTFFRMSKSERDNFFEKSKSEIMEIKKKNWSINFIIILLFYL